MNLSFKKQVLLIVILAGFTIMRAQKMAHVNLDSLINNMTETKAARQVIDKFRMDLETESINMQTEFDNKVKDYQEKEKTYSEPVKQSKISDIQQLQKRLGDFKNQAYSEIQKKYAEMTAPIVGKAKKGVEAIAKENGYKYVLDTSVGNVLYSEASDDIYIAVLKKLESMPPAELPGSKSPVKPPVKKTAPAKGK